MIETALAFVLGLLIGSFLNVVILRLPVSMQHQWRIQCQELLAKKPSSDLQTPPPSIVYPPSRCPKCRSEETTEPLIEIRS